ncbi:UvrD-helicase domain-containing protein [Salipiger mucosus]|uniref:UvrD-helicase domain-containing protein n=1 Tax=Salipiger mucosus TaxID=263378 RepID=UPI002480C339|nr:UvrD-helicase domain-containing protein [Salipiger mucosus]
MKHPVEDRGGDDRIAEDAAPFSDGPELFGKPKLLIVDELGYLPFEPDAAHLFFQLVSRRYERGALFVTSNKPHVTLRPIPDIEVYDRVAEVGVVDSFTSLMGTFLRHFKNGGYRVEDCSDKAQTLEMGKRAEAFLKIFGAVFREYQARLGDRIDFEDMVNRATALVESGRYQSPFRHILVDEFQDISTGRAKLIQALKRQHSDAKVFAVGDDWQSIYRFAGSDIHIMRNFGAEFGGAYAGATGVHRTVDLGRTFRSVDKIALAARRFVLRNPAQITKMVIPAGETDEPSIRIAWTRRDTGEKALNDAVAALSATEGKGGGETFHPDPWAISLPEA